MNKKISDNYFKIVEWSEEDKCYVGSAPGLFIGGVHGKNQDKVFKELCDIVEETITIMLKEARPLPKGNFNKKFYGKVALRIPPELHKVLAVKAMQEGESINKYIVHNLSMAI